MPTTPLGRVSDIVDTRHATSPTTTVRHARTMSGFSLLELIAVLLILAVAFTILLPGLFRGSSSELLAAARVVAAGLRQTRDRAITTNRATVMEFDVERRRIVLETRARLLPQWARLGLFTARSERIDETRGTIRFFPDGSSTGGRVTLGTDDRSIQVDVDWLTGRVSILEGTPKDWDAPTAFAPVHIE